MPPSKCRIFTGIVVCLIAASSLVCDSTAVEGQRQEKLIDILQNLQLSIAEILNTLGPNALSGGKSSSSSSSSSGSSISSPKANGERTLSRDLPGRALGRSNSDHGGSSKETGLGSSLDTPPGSSVGSRGGSSSVGGSTPSSSSSSSSSGIPKKYGTGKQFRCAATYAGSYGHEYEKPSLHHSSHFGVSSNHDFTPHMIEARWSSEAGWEPAFIVPHQNISLFPSAKVLTHGQQVFDVLQALMGFDNRIRLFRPNLHLERFRRSAARLGLPDVDTSEMTICLKRLILTDASFLPPSYSNGSLEIRAVMMGVDDDMRIKPGEDVILYVFMNRHTTATLNEISKPQSVYADSQYTRSWVGGLGEFKTSANYAPTLLVTQIAQQQGYNDVLWLYSKEELITSLNMANVFVFIINELGKRELITPPLNGLIVPGIIRQTILEMTRHWNEFDVTERSISIHEIRTLRRQGRLLEIFSSNTMSNAVPITSIYYAPIRTVIRVPTLDQRDPLYLRLNRAIHAIEYGLIVHPWGEIV